ncbi:hypothetical protein M409DRAFT_61356 [Zasmidium cellare ATCC 36951]|uniref:Uncharacterized protein n=1 Tax=Zasmidium cellare ATCC 36951 TaxID=1080233 RepID=A0A6A6BVE5_ZASCE|nr:uncharacterized protein M409DRAFT_61356 [Zasmidium cellare ATCC 36951]KAF2158767.1 hypothetical protein M409DRAFT_61356 [Zasmidium cellare ATCC 36951]
MIQGTAQHGQEADFELENKDSRSYTLVEDLPPADRIEAFLGGTGTRFSFVGQQLWSNNASALRCLLTRTGMTASEQHCWWLRTCGVWANGAGLRRPSRPRPSWNLSPTSTHLHHHASSPASLSFTSVGSPSSPRQHRPTRTGNASPAPPASPRQHQQRLTTLRLRQLIVVASPSSPRQHRLTTGNASPAPPASPFQHRSANMSSVLQDGPAELFDFDAASEASGDPPAVPGDEMAQQLQCTELVDSLTAAATAAPGSGEAEILPTCEQASGALGNGDNPPQATLTFVIQDQNFSNSVELGILNEHPEALKAITPTQSLTSSTFFVPAIRAAMSVLQSEWVDRLAAELTAISLQQVEEVLSRSNPLASESSMEYQEFADIIGGKLNEALPRFEWQGPTNSFARARYIMAMLEEALRVLGARTEPLITALRSHARARSALKRIAHAIAESDRSPAELYGQWAHDTLLSALLFGRKPNRYAETFQTAGQNQEPSYQAVEASTDDSDSDVEDSRPTKLGSKRLIQDKSQHLTLAEGAEDDPVCMSDSDTDDSAHCKSKHRSTRQKAVDYNMKHHPQDGAIPRAYKRRKVTGKVVKK